MKAAVGPGGLLLEVGEAGGGKLSVIFRMVIKAGAGISSFGYPVAMRIETETDTRLEIRVLALDDEFIVATIIIS